MAIAVNPQWKQQRLFFHHPFNFALPPTSLIHSVQTVNACGLLYLAARHPYTDSTSSTTLHHCQQHSGAATPDEIIIVKNMLNQGESEQ